MSKKSSTFSTSQVDAAATARDAATANTPSVVLDAFVPDPIRVGNIELRPFTLATFMFLEKIESPLVKATAGDPTTMDIAAAVYVLTHEMGECRVLLRKGRDDFDESVWEFAQSVPATDLAALGAKIKQYLDKAFATVVTDSKEPVPAEKKSESVDGSPTLNPSMPSPESLKRTPGSDGP